MDPLYIAVVVIGTVEIALYIASIIFIIAFRKNKIVQSLHPPVAIAMMISYTVSTVTPMVTARGAIPCLLYLYLPYENVILLASGYIAMSWTMISCVTITKKRIKEQETLLMKEASGVEISRSRWSFIENFMMDHPILATSRMSIVIFVASAVLMTLVPVIVNFLDPIYLDLDAYCEDRTLIDLTALVTLMLIIFAFLIYALIKMRRYRDPYGEQQRLFGLIIVWIVTTVMLAAIVAVDDPWMRAIYTIGSVVVIGIMWAIHMSHPIRKVTQSFFSGGASTLSTSDEGDATVEKITLQTILDDDKDRTLMNFITNADRYGTAFLGWGYTIMMLKAWGLRKKRMIDSVEGRWSATHLHYQEYVKNNARYQATLPPFKDYEDILTKIDKEDLENIDKEDSEKQKSSERLFDEMEQLHVDTYKYIDDHMFPAYKKTILYVEFVSNYNFKHNRSVPSYASSDISRSSSTEGV